jgi:alpha-beta hydrolase superfamily lysophospholipase
MLIIHGADDRIVDPTASLVLFKSPASRGLKELKIYPEMKHELLEDPENGTVFENILEWLRKQMTQCQ